MIYHQDCAYRGVRLFEIHFSIDEDYYAKQRYQFHTTLHTCIDMVIMWAMIYTRV